MIGGIYKPGFIQSGCLVEKSPRHFYFCCYFCLKTMKNVMNSGIIWSWTIRICSSPFVNDIYHKSPENCTEFSWPDKLMLVGCCRQISWAIAAGTGKASLSHLHPSNNGLGGCWMRPHFSSLFCIAHQPRNETSISGFCFFAISFFPPEVLHVTLKWKHIKSA